MSDLRNIGDFAIQVLSILLRGEKINKKIIYKGKKYALNPKTLKNADIPPYILYKKVIRALKDMGFIRSYGCENGVYFIKTYNRGFKYIPHKKEVRL